MRATLWPVCAHISVLIPTVLIFIIYKHQLPHLHNLESLWRHMSKYRVQEIQFRRDVLPYNWVGPVGPGHRARTSVGMNDKIVIPLRALARHQETKTAAPDAKIFR